MLSVCCAIRRLRRRSIYAWTAILQGKSGPPCPCGLMKDQESSYQRFHRAVVEFLLAAL
jgi:hypothetical protein